MKILRFLLACAKWTGKILLAIPLFAIGIVATIALVVIMVIVAILQIIMDLAQMAWVNRDILEFLFREVFDKCKNIIKDHWWLRVLLIAAIIAAAIATIAKLALYFYDMFASWSCHLTSLYMPRL